MTHHMKLSVDFSICGIMWVLKKFQIWQYFRVWMFGLGMHTLLLLGSWKTGGTSGRAGPYLVLVTITAVTPCGDLLLE
jgi:hypothetical protein